MLPGGVCFNSPAPPEPMVDSHTCCWLPAQSSALLGPLSRPGQKLALPSLRWPGTPRGATDDEDSLLWASVENRVASWHIHSWSNYSASQRFPTDSNKSSVQIVSLRGLLEVSFQTDKDQIPSLQMGITSSTLPWSHLPLPPPAVRTRPPLPPPSGLCLR